MSKRKPRVITACVANHYTSDNERIVEFSFPGTEGPAGGLLSLRQRDEGLPLVMLYRLDGCEPYVSVESVPALFTDDEKSTAIRNGRHAGSFMASLVQAWEVADSANGRRIEVAFGDVLRRLL